MEVIASSHFLCSLLFRHQAVCLSAVWATVLTLGPSQHAHPDAHRREAVQMPLLRVRGVQTWYVLAPLLSFTLPFWSVLFCASLFVSFRRFSPAGHHI